MASSNWQGRVIFGQEPNDIYLQTNTYTFHEVDFFINCIAADICSFVNLRGNISMLLNVSV